MDSVIGPYIFHAQYLAFCHYQAESHAAVTEKEHFHVYFFKHSSWELTFYREDIIPEIHGFKVIFPSGVTTVPPLLLNWRGSPKWIKQEGIRCQNKFPIPCATWAWVLGWQLGSRFTCHFAYGIRLIFTSKIWRCFPDEFRVH